MTKRELRKKVVAILYENLVSVDVKQKRPNTMVEVIAEFNSKKYKGLGFAKVCIPDVWNSTYGIKLARAKAIADISREIVNGPGRGDAMAIVFSKQGG